MYQKEIIYLNLFENEIKVTCVGYYKLEKTQNNYSIEIQVKNVPKRLSGKFPIRLQGENDWKEADMLIINDGTGKWAGSIAGPVFRAEIILTDSYKIKGESRNAAGFKEKIEVVYKVKHEAEDEDKHETKAAEAAALLEDKNDKSMKEKSVWKSEDNQRSRSGGKSRDNQRSMERWNSRDNQRGIEGEGDKDNKKNQSNKIENVPLYENKWEQLMATYERIHPYGDNRVYIKLAPKDFIILRSDYQHLVNNSFLLHGFYNYRYLILGKEKNFYIGVPGVFYEREKMVALMFGFEAFECEGGEAEEGKFGYYLRKVEI